MSSFKMRNRPKKPTKPTEVDVGLGEDCISLPKLLVAVEKFKNENPEVDSKDIKIEVDYRCYSGSEFCLTAPPQSREIYEEKLQEYKIEYKSYKAWQVKYKKEITKHNVAKKKATAKTKLQRTQTRLNKELIAVKAKLEKT
ncbi:hypothetical protein LCGC14_0208130 [marine sediment metagenome]|uniref:Uncharacterized protein n=1 Tax=marine sediment metagenome TaxID=412755 RepID=A0A0F9UXV0_9ZZZZ